MLDVDSVLEAREPKPKKEGRPYIYSASNGRFFQMDHEQFPQKLDCVVYSVPGVGVVLQECNSGRRVNEEVLEATGEEIR